MLLVTSERLKVVLLLLLSFLILLVSPTCAMASKAALQNPLNVFKRPLALFSKEPLTGYYRTGYCEVGADDSGNHSVAAELTDPFLDFSAARGNNLRSIGLTAGCKWCLCAARWREALREGGGREGVVPKVHLEATSERALEVVGLEDLRKFAVDGKGDGNGANGMGRKEL